MDRSLDAAGRTLLLGDRAAGIPDVFAAAAFFGTVLTLDPGTVVLVDDDGNQASIPAGRVFRLGRDVSNVLGAMAIQYLDHGPALYYLTELQGDPATGLRTITRVDQAAPDNPRDRAICRALGNFALDAHKHLVIGRTGDRAGTTDGPALVYIGGDHATVVRVDQEPVHDTREAAICSALLWHALALIEQEMPTATDLAG